MKPYNKAFQADESICYFLPVDLGKWYYYIEEELIGPFETQQAAERARLGDCMNGSCEE